MGLPSIGSWDRLDSRKRSCFHVVSGNHRYCTRGANPERGRELLSEAPNRLKLWTVIPRPCRRSPRRRGREVSKASVVAGRIETICRRVRRRGRDTLPREGFLGRIAVPHEILPFFEERRIRYAVIGGIGFGGVQPQHPVQRRGPRRLDIADLVRCNWLMLIQAPSRVPSGVR